MNKFIKFFIASLAICTNTYAVEFAAKTTLIVDDNRPRCAEIAGVSVGNVADYRTRVLDINIANGMVYCDAVNILYTHPTWPSAAEKEEMMKQPYEFYQNTTALNQNYANLNVFVGLTDKSAQDQRLQFFDELNISVANNGFNKGIDKVNLKNETAEWLYPQMVNLHERAYEKKDPTDPSASGFIVPEKFLTSLEEIDKKFIKNYLAAGYNNRFYFSRPNIYQVSGYEQMLNDYFDLIRANIEGGKYSRMDWLEKFMENALRDSSATGKLGFSGEALNQLSADLKASITNYQEDVKDKLFPNIKEKRVSLSKLVTALLTFDDKLIKYKNNANGLMQIDKIRDLGLDSADLSATLQGSNIAGLEDSFHYLDLLQSDNFNYYTSLFQLIQDLYATIIRILLAAIGSYFFFLAAVKHFILKHVEKSEAELRWKSKLLAIAISLGVFFVPSNFKHGIGTTFFLSLWTSALQQGATVADYATKLGYVATLSKAVPMPRVPQLEEVVDSLDEYAYHHILELMYKDAVNKECIEEPEGQPKFSRGLASFLSKDWRLIWKSEEVAYASVTRENDVISFRACRNMLLRAKYHEQMSKKGLVNHVNTFFSTLRDFEEVLEYASSSTEAPGDKTIAAPGSSGEIGSIFTQHKPKAADAGTVAPNAISAAIYGGAITLNQTGWIGASLLPAQALVIKDSLSKQTKYYASAKNLNEEDEEFAQEQSQPGASFSPTKEASGERVEKIVASAEPYVGTMPYMLLPGSGTVLGAISALGKNASDLLSSIPVLSSALSGMANLGGKMSSYWASIYVIEAILERLPLVFATVVAMVISIIYFYELAIYVFVSPLVVIFAFTNGQISRINQFIARGVVLALKPLLITLGILLSLFLYYLLQDLTDIFIGSYKSSLGSAMVLLDSSINRVASTLSFSLLHIIGSIGATWLIIKAIIALPSGALRMLGLGGPGGSSEIGSELKAIKSNTGFN